MKTFLKFAAVAALTLAAAALLVSGMPLGSIALSGAATSVMLFV